jgi:hypothetical protein
MLRREFLVMLGVAGLAGLVLADKPPKPPSSPRLPKPPLPVYVITFRNQNGRTATRRVRANSPEAARARFHQQNPNVTIIGVSQ